MKNIINVCKTFGKRPEKVAVLRETVLFDEEGNAVVSEEVANVLEQIPGYEVLRAPAPEPELPKAPEPIEEVQEAPAPPEPEPIEEVQEAPNVEAPEAPKKAAPRKPTAPRKPSPKKA